MLLLAHKKCQEATPAFAYKRSRPPGPAASRFENGWTRLWNDQIERPRTRSCLCETNGCCFFSHSYQSGEAQRGFWWLYTSSWL